MKLRYIFVLVVCLFSMSCVFAKSQIVSVEQQLNDSVISTKINAKLTKKGQMNPLKMHVSTKNGVVTLRGYARDRQAFVDALRIAKSTKGVKRVNAEALTIKSVNTPITDAYITAKVEAAILKAKVFDDESIPLVGIQAKTTNGKVVLSGFVKRKTSIPFVVKRVYAVRGVKHVFSQLEVAAAH